MYHASMYVASTHTIQRTAVDKKHHHRCEYKYEHATVALNHSFGRRSRRQTKLDTLSRSIIYTRILNCATYRFFSNVLLATA